ncbi:MAG: hypothetical protein DYG93_00275 [Leptolyngbya sp. PLA2]|nr:hypothetical protein [Leptolyngbya sp. PL-A2]MCQ3940169.1 hypothetical protein [cyanobacterium CYA1]
MAPFRDFPTASSVRPHLANLALPPGDDLAAADNDTLRLINLTGDTIYFRLIQQSPEAYRAWRESSGYVFRDAAAMRRELVPQDYEFLFQESYPGDDHIVSVFDRLWTVARDRFNGAAMPVALPAEGTGLAIAFGQIEFGQEIRLPVLSGTLPGDVWMGRSQIGFRNWWSDPEGGAMQALQRHGRLRVALVGVILELQSGERYPFSFLYYQVPSGEWWLWRMNVLNTTPERGVMFEL